MSRCPWTHIYASCIAGMTGMHKHALLLLVEMGCLELFYVRLVLNREPPDVYLPE
jgi:hypothetical protein